MADNMGIAVWIASKIEDDPRHPGVIKNLGDGADLTRFGLTQKWVSPYVPASFWQEMPYDQALQAAVTYYNTFYCNHLLVSQQNASTLAACIVSWSVNNKIATAVKALQRILDIDDDGILGPKTVTLLNQEANIAGVEARYRTAWETFYQREVQFKPKDAQFLDGWLARARRIYPN